MPGWIIQGVRGEGKSLAAVSKIREYMLDGRPVATNLDLFLEFMLPDDNKTISYRLPDHPRLEDFQILPPAYDPKYKGEDRNGLLVLDELATWFNSRSWSDKTRLGLICWLLLSRKQHWDLILLVQSYDMVDTQIQNSLCDYLVQASRLDRQSIPYIAGFLKMLGISSMMPKIHRYHVFYGLSQQVKPTDTWTVRGTSLYDAYDTNQMFKNGVEAFDGQLVDMRGTYSYLPACYLTKRVFIDRLQLQINDLKKPVQKGDDMARKGVGSEGNYAKIGLLALLLVGILGYRFFTKGFSLPEATKLASSKPVPAQLNPVQPMPVQSVPVQPIPVQSVPVQSVNVETANFLDYLIQNFRPRLSSVAYSPDKGFLGFINWYQGNELRETYSIASLHDFGVILIHREYGIEMVYKGKSYPVTSWKIGTDVLPESTKVQASTTRESDKSDGSAGFISKNGLI